MFDRLMTTVGKIRDYGCDKLDDHKVVKIMLKAYSPRNDTEVTLIRDKKREKVKSKSKAKSPQPPSDISSSDISF